MFGKIYRSEGLLIQRIDRPTIMYYNVMRGTKRAARSTERALRSTERAVRSTKRAVRSTKRAVRTTTCAVRSTKRAVPAPSAPCTAPIAPCAAPNAPCAAQSAPSAAPRAPCAALTWLALVRSLSQWWRCTLPSGAAHRQARHAVGVYFALRSSPQTSAHPQRSCDKPFSVCTATKNIVYCVVV